MIVNLKEVNIYLKPGPSNMNHQITGFAHIVQAEMNLDVFSKSIFVFCGPYRKTLKVLYWNLNGFCLWIKKLHKDRFPWPKPGNPYMEITYAQFNMILNGINFFTAHKEIKNKSLI